jgi:hypothetical protein
VVSNVVAWGITGSSAIITWSTDIPGDTAIEYGTSTALGQTSPVQPSLAASHAVTLTGINGGTTYYFRARSTSSSGAVGYSSILSFTTLDSSAPVVSNVQVTPQPGNAATVSWTISKSATSYVEFGSDTNYGRYSPSTTGTSTALGWTPSGTVHFRIWSTDSRGNTAVTSDLTFVEP